jgi:radical SAM protein with 4Fe4S-binding SPASM domain
MAGVRRLVAAGVRTEVRATISRDNVGDLKALRELGRELTGREDIDVCMMLTRAVRGACTRPEEKRVTPAEVAARRVSEIDCESVRAAPKEAAVSVVRNSGAAPSPMFCAGGRGSFWIAWDGRMLPCALMDRPFTQPFQEGFAPAWRRLTAETDTIPGAAACGPCEHRPYCSVCPGRLQAETGSFAEVAPYVCEVARRLHEAAGIADQG